MIDLEAEYNNRAKVPESSALIAGWAQDAQAYRDSGVPIRAIPYGSGARNTITVGSRVPVVHVPSAVMSLASQALGLLVRDVVLTTDEIRGLMAGLLVSHAPPFGRIAFTDWLAANAGSLGRAYANELGRHFAVSTASA